MNYISFTGKTNKDLSNIDSAVFTLASGTKIKLDRNKQYSEVAEDGTFELVWEHIYIWSIDDCCLFFEDKAEIDDFFELNLLLRTAEVELILKKNADADTEITDVKFSVYKE